MIIEYNASVKTEAGWRSVTIRAEATQASAAMAEVTKVISIDGEMPGYGMSRTGARRQQYNGKYVAEREIGARKRLSACEIIEAAAA
jgi:hypothetical protein